MINYDITMTGKENMLARLNRNSSLDAIITSNDVVFGTPIVVTGRSDANTTINIKRNNGSTLFSFTSPDITLFYTRYDLDEVLKENKINLVFDEPITRYSKSKLRAKFLELTGNMFNRDDINITLQSNQAVVTMASNHLGLIGKTIMHFAEVTIG